MITVLIPWYWWILHRRNRTRDPRFGQLRGTTDDHSSYSSDSATTTDIAISSSTEAIATPRIQQVSLYDLTDRQNKAFRYTT
jgi:hypothetical protein